MRKVVPKDAVLVPPSAKRMFEGAIFDVYQWSQQMFDDTKVTFEMLRRPDTVEILAVVDNKIVILNEEQPHAGKRVSLPGGRVDKIDKSTQIAAARELHEETGYSMSNWKLINVVQPHVKLEWFIYTFLAWGVVSQEGPHQDSGEKIEIALETYERVKQMSMERTGYLGEALETLEKAGSLEGLIDLPEYQGQTVNR